MRLLLPAIGIVVLIAAGYALQTHFSSKQVAAAEATAGVPVYELHANKLDIKTLQEQGTSSIAGAVVDWFDAIDAGPEPGGVLAFEAAGDRGD